MTIEPISSQVFRAAGMKDLNNNATIEKDQPKEGYQPKFDLDGDGKISGREVVDYYCRKLLDQKTFYRAFKTLVAMLGREQAYYCVGLAVRTAYMENNAKRFTSLVRFLEDHNQLDVLITIESDSARDPEKIATKVIDTIADNVLNEFPVLNSRDKEHQEVRNPIVEYRCIRYCDESTKLISLENLYRAPKLQARVFAEAKKERPDVPVAVKKSQPSCIRGQEKGSYMVGLTLTFTNPPKNTGGVHLYTLTPTKKEHTYDVWPQTLFENCSFTSDFGVCSGTVFLDDKEEARLAFAEYNRKGVSIRLDVMPFCKPSDNFICQPRPLGESAKFKLSAPYHDGYCSK